MSASYNNSFGQSDVGAPNMGMISSSDASGVGPVISGDSGGDIIISSSDGSRGGKRRWPIVVAILLFLVAIGAGVGALMIGKPSGDNPLLKVSFNEYANYVMYGKTSSDIFDIHGIDDAYYFEIVVWNKDYDELEKIAEYQNAFGSKIEDNNTLKTMYDEQVNYLDFIKQILLKDDVSWIDLMPVYKESGRVAVKSMYNGYYGSSYEETLIKEFIDEYHAWLDGQLDLFDYYNQSGCFSNDYLDDECLFSLIEEEDLQKFQELKDDVAKGRRELKNYSGDIVVKYIDNVIKLNALINNVDSLNESVENNSGGKTGE